MRIAGKVAVIVGAGQSPGEGIGNGRATTLRFAQEGARILAVDRLIASAEETAAMATQGGECVPFAADVTKEETLAAAMEAARARWGRIDILHNNVGVSIGGGDKPLDELSEEAFDRGPKRRVVPSPIPISICPASIKMYCRRGAVCQSLQ